MSEGLIPEMQLFPTPKKLQPFIAPQSKPSLVLDRLGGFINEWEREEGGWVFSPLSGLKMAKENAHTCF